MKSETIPRLSVYGLTKNFGGVRALDGADLTVRPGEVHGLLGSNGSGKSTLIKALSGFHSPQSGSLEIDGRYAPLPMPLGHSEAYGMAFVHQNLGLLLSGTVLENLIAGDNDRLKNWHINWSREAARARKLFEEHQLDILPEQIVGDLQPVKRAQLAIVRAANRILKLGEYRTPGLLVLDEPTPFLPQEHVNDLFTMIRTLTAKGTSIVFVSHDIDEILEITDRSTVLRDGKVIGTFDTKSTDRSDLVEAIVGRKITTERNVTTFSPATCPVAKISGLAGKIVKDIDLEVQPGEILGLTGLIGSGYDEVPMLLSGSQKAKSGTLTLDQKSISVPDLTAKIAIKKNIVFIPADRQWAGIAPELTLTENVTLPILDNVWYLDQRRLQNKTKNLLELFSVKANSSEQMASELSGGNQQKLVLGKWLQLDPNLVLLDEPTQGIDVGARQEIYNRLNEITIRGGAVICSTSEFEQLEKIAHRVLVFDRGKISAEIKGEEISKSSIAEACYKATKSNAAA
tara:strand:- start:60 stop:1601 length:1542 start_codon:yes stop_codon:yes gene_type:complete